MMEAAIIIMALIYIVIFGLGWFIKQGDAKLARILADKRRELSSHLDTKFSDRIEPVIRDANNLMKAMTKENLLYTQNLLKELEVALISIRKEIHDECKNLNFFPTHPFSQDGVTYGSSIESRINSTLLSIRRFKEGNGGYVYVLTNPSMPGLIKIGKTNRSPDERARELSTSTGVPTPYVVFGSVWTLNYENLEKWTHRKFSPFRIRSEREFFRMDPTEALRLIENFSKGY